MKNDIAVYVYFQPETKASARLIGTLNATMSKNRRAYSFEYSKEWLQQDQPFFLDPDIEWYSGRQFPRGKANFGIIFDSMPDTWGRTLIKRKTALEYRAKNLPVPVLHDIDFLLAVHDKSRMGALRFKTDKEGAFLNNDSKTAIPPWSSVRELQSSALQIENDNSKIEISKWLATLLAPGSSLGGARPKANIADEKKHPWIAKFPAKNDTTDKALWEFLAYKLAVNAGITMAECKVEKVSSNYHTFFTKRFDRNGCKRIHFASAMSLTGNTEMKLRDYTASYLEIAEFIQYSGVEVQKNLEQLWRRIAFNIAVSNTDDHLRNHGFLLNNNQWQLSPAYDINPSTEKAGLALNIDMDSNALDFELLKSVGKYFQLKTNQMDEILAEVKQAVSHWESTANELQIPRQEIELMRAAFRF